MYFGVVLIKRNILSRKKNKSCDELITFGFADQEFEYLSIEREDIDDVENRIIISNDPQ
jgi:hypothetical protein